MTVRQLLASMDSREFSEWMAFCLIEPFGEEWKQTGTISASMAGGDPSKYIPYPPAPKVQDPSEMEAIAKAVLASVPQKKKK